MDPTNPLLIRCGYDAAAGRLIVESTREGVVTAAVSLPMSHSEAKARTCGVSQGDWLPPATLAEGVFGVCPRCADHGIAGARCSDCGAAIYARI
jgi:hypothetical protein